MTSRDFCYWLQGFFEINAAAGITVCGLTPEQAEMVKRHLALVFIHEIDPSMGGPDKQQKLNEAHGATVNPAKPIVPAGLDGAWPPPKMRC